MGCDRVTGARARAEDPLEVRTMAFLRRHGFGVLVFTAGLLTSALTYHVSV
jgi:hypothetical protein